MRAVSKQPHQLAKTIQTRPTSKQWVAAFAALVSVITSPARAETRNYVMSLFSQAANSGADDKDCPGGVNPTPMKIIARELAAIGIPEKEVETITTSTQGGGPAAAAAKQAILYRGRAPDGTPRHAYTYPSTVPDPNISLFEGRYAYGFNLDGKEDAKSFEDPDTHERGVDNAYWRAAGCVPDHRGTLTDPSAKWEAVWHIGGEGNPAYLISINADDFSKNGPATIVLQKALERISRDALGGVTADGTYRVDPRWKTTLHGRLENGVVTVSEPSAVRLGGDPYLFYMMTLDNAQLRLKIKDDKSLVGIMGGYMPWRMLYYVYALDGYTEEYMNGTDVIAMYWALRKNADAFPDPRTGENTVISTAFEIKAVPAFIRSVEAQR